MTRSIDLMPEAARRRLGHQRQVRRWALLYTANAATIAALFLGFGLAKDAAHRRVAHLQQQVELDANQRLKASKLRSRIATLEGRIERHDRLAWPTPISEIIAAIGQVMPEPVALTFLGVTPRIENVRRSARSQRDTPGDRRGKLIVELQGLAAGDLEIASFVQGLDHHPLFASVAVDYARKGEVRGVKARAFGLTCEVDLSKTYVFSDDGGDARPTATDDSEPREGA